MQVRATRRYALAHWDPPGRAGKRSDVRGVSKQFPFWFPRNEGEPSRRREVLLRTAGRKSRIPGFEPRRDGNAVSEPNLPRTRGQQARRREPRIPPGILPMLKPNDFSPPAAPPSGQVYFLGPRGGLKTIFGSLGVGHPRFSKIGLALRFWHEFHPNSCSPEGGDPSTSRSRAASGACQVLKIVPEP